MVFESILDSVLGPLLKLPGLLTIFILSFLITIFITLVQKFTTDQNRLKQIKEEMKTIQKRMKDEKDPQEKMRLQKESMKFVPEQMKITMKSMLYTILPLFVLFPWMSNNLAFEPIYPGEEFTVSVFFENGANGEIEIDVPEGITVIGDKTHKINGGEEVNWNLKGDSGEYLLQFITNNSVETKEVLITDEQKYKINKKSKKTFTLFEPPEPFIKDDSMIKMIKTNHNNRVYLSALKVINWGGWLSTYFIFSILTSILIRKILKVH